MIGCPLNSDTEPWHRAQPVHRHASRIDIEYLKNLVGRSQTAEQTECYWVRPATSRTKFCGMYHEYVKHMLNTL